MNRRHLIPLALAALALTAGCAGFFGGGEVDDERLDEEPAQPYEWESDANAHITITGDSQFQAVYRLNRSSVELFRRDGLGGRNAIPVSAMRYRYPNGTVITGSEFDEHGGGVERSRESVTVTLPDDEGRLAFTSSSTPKRFSLPTFVNGSYAVVLPPDRRVEVFPFGKVSPRNYEVEIRGDRRVIHWQSVEAESVSVQYYLQRDLYIFGGAAVILLVVGVGGVFHYRRRIEALRRRREEMGLDVETDDDDDFGRNPPPGM